MIAVVQWGLTDAMGARVAAMLAPCRKGSSSAMIRGGRVAMAMMIVAASSVPALAKATWVKKAQAIDPAIKDCLACHLTKKGRDLNSGRGQFLFDKKNELGA